MSFDYNKALGQNFLKDNNIINKISESINPSKNDLIIEIGPGAGALTKKLVAKDSDVICFEIDKRLEPILNEIKSDKLKVYFEDFLKANLKVTERHPHSLEVKYVEPDKDAATSYGGKDFKFANDKDYAIKINSYVYENKIVVALYKA